MGVRGSFKGEAAEVDTDIEFLEPFFGGEDQGFERNVALRLSLLNQRYCGRVLIGQ